MEATSTETTRFCPMCAAPLRPRAVFCHRCGKPYPEESAVVYKTKESSGDVPTTEEFEAQWNTLTNDNGGSQVAAMENPQPVLPESETNVDENANEEKPSDEQKSEQEKNEKNRRVRRRVVQTTEYVWEEHSSDPTWRFALATIIVLIFAFLILWFGSFIHF
jgi:cobalamin biosynthesis Mg chelatase CobN